MANIHSKTAISNIRRSPFQAIAAILVLAVTFFVITLLTVLVYASDNVLTHFETRPQVIIFLKDEIDTNQVTELQNKLQNDTRVRSVKYISKEEALNIYKEATSDNPLLSELVSPSIFPASLEFSVNELNFASAMIDELKNDPLVDQVGFTANIGSEANLKDTVSKLKNFTWYLRLGGGIFASILTTTSFLVLLIIISMRITARRHEVEILDLIGATKGFIKKPIMLEALLYSFLGVLVGWVFALIIVLYSTPTVVRYFSEIEVLPKDTVMLFAFFGIVLLVELFVGSLLAIVGSNIAIARAHKAK